jgi:hypothetical protein
MILKTDSSINKVKYPTHLTLKNTDTSNNLKQEQQVFNDANSNLANKNFNLISIDRSPSSSFISKQIIVPNTPEKSSKNVNTNYNQNIANGQIINSQYSQISNPGF